MKLNIKSLNDKAGWEAAQVKLPGYDVAAVAQKTSAAPVWVHFGAGNIFRGFIAALQHRLLNEGLAECGIVVAETFDPEIIEKIYELCDNLTLNVTLNPDASVGCEIIAAVAEAVKTDECGLARLSDVFEADSLQMVSLTITEKGYSVSGADVQKNPAQTRHAAGVLTALLLRRYIADGKPIACVSMDNCSHNGEKLRAAVLAFAEAWVKGGLEGVTFPWSMIDKITPRPAKPVEKLLTSRGIEGMSPLVTLKGTYIAAFVNAERPQYLVIEDSFPSGRPSLDKAGVYMTDRETVNKVERMKVTTCLNPLHTAMSVYGCLLGYTLICDEMKDAEIVALIRRLGYGEGLPVVTDPGILSPEAFIDEVVNERLPNPFMPDDPRRIATDTSQKVGIRFGETVKSYIEQGRDLNALAALPLAIAGWFRYLLAVDDAGNKMEVSPDPLKDELQAKLAGIAWNKPESYTGQLKEILNDKAIFGLDLTETPLCAKIEEMFAGLLTGPGAARAALKKYLAE